ncbi:MAG: response regulator transcription factor [Tepidibacter sp.]|jgi:DNA-binding response OmpR family regulator|uniref:response regulator transcription factor n=1 Tax=Tepidibacter sp. TaxID=2529387 RepID=UPI0025E3E2ED|nr:response regulator transcription factor [Tepidibacter sp.]MCT4509453.1 response regulator transcription factor [Tepidibacter sp.]
MKIKKILIADDEKRMRKLVSDFLKKEGYSIIEANDGEEALDIFERENDIDLVILDVMMPKYDGWMVCRKIRSKSSVPIIMLTARSEEFDELFGFEMGADEYVKKPFSPKILVARVNALIRRSKEEKKDIQVFKELKIDDNAKVVYIEGKETELSPKEYELLLYMINNKGVALSREQILNNVWGYDYFGELRTVDTHINRLRIKLEGQSDLIRTVRGVGYRFEVEK